MTEIQDIQSKMMDAPKCGTIQGEIISGLLLGLNSNKSRALDLIIKKRFVYALMLEIFIVGPQK